MTWPRLFVVVMVAGIFAACESSRPAPMFSRLPSSATGITFANEIEGRPDRHVLNYTYLYNGGGVAAGDVNGDGRTDLYFTASMGPNALYLNQGDFRFEDVTEAAGVQDTTGWTTGVTMADVNGDGHLDIYVCKSGTIGAPHRANKLYVNAGDGTFTERAAAYGLAATAYSTHATFFDYDRDGDLDLYLLNNPPIRDARISARPTLQQRRTYANDQLYRNEMDASGRGRFVNVTDQSGLVTDEIGFGLSATVSDINQDGWPDVYVANDFNVEDRLYMNQGDGTFDESIHDGLDHISRSSMGSDIADYNNDGRPDIFVADMLPEDNRRQKLLNVGQRSLVEYQYVRNTLQLNNGDESFSEIGRLAGVASTDWSWATLFADFDLDGHKDLYVTNGIRYDYTNMDFQFSDYVPALQEGGMDDADLYALVENIPSTPIPNYLFRNRGDLTFETVSAAWGVDQPGFSNGAAYADLNNDGALDLVVNNIDEAAWIYRNNARTQTDHRFLRVALEGADQNPFGIGATVRVSGPEEGPFVQEMIMARGFQSSVEPVLTFGLGTADTVDVTVTWPDQTRQTLAAVPANQTITLRQDAAQPMDRSPASDPSSRPVRSIASESRGLTFRHKENPYEDYRNEPLVPHMLARLGPALARGDANGDGRDDVFVGGATDQPSALFVQRADGSFRPVSIAAFDADASYEDVAATFVDVDGDGHQDLYVVSGGREAVRPEAYQDRLYINDGTGQFTAAPDRLPPVESSGGAVAAHDYDEDGDVDLFVGGRVRSVGYPLSPRSYLLENTGGRFRDVTAQGAEALQRPGMVTDAHWTNLVGDDARELVIAGEWMPIRVFQRNGAGGFAEITDSLGLSRSNGWWNRLGIVDFDGDGDLDVIAGNRGENVQIGAQPEAPASIYAADFDRDRSIEPIMSHYVDGTEVPVPRRDRLVDELSLLEARFPTYASYTEATMDEVLIREQWEQAQRFVAYTFTTSLFEQQEDGTFRHHALPIEAQFSPTRGMVIRDLNGDDRPDVLLAGNDFTVRMPWGPSDAGKGLLLLNRGNLNFKAVRSLESGFFAPGDVRDLLAVETSDGPLVLVGNNDGPLELFRIDGFDDALAARSIPSHPLKRPSHSGSLDLDWYDARCGLSLALLGRFAADWGLGATGLCPGGR